MHPLLRSFGAVLRRRREAAGLSQEALAAQASLHRNYVGMLERGERAPTIITASQLATALGLSLSQFLSEVEQELGSEGPGDSAYP